jgi:hypothetical protein
MALNGTESITAFSKRKQLLPWFPSFVSYQKRNRAFLPLQKHAAETCRKTLAEARKKHALTNLFHLSKIRFVLGVR